MKLIYTPDIDTLDIFFDEAQPVDATYDGPNRNGAPSGGLLVYYRGGRLAGFAIEHASEHAPAAWDIPVVRKTAAALAADTGQAVRCVELNASGRIVDATFDAERGPQSAPDADKAIRAYNQLVREHQTRQPA